MCMLHSIDTRKAERFAGDLLGYLNGGSLAIMISLGHRSGLFDVMSTLPPSTSREIADAAELDERYVREWLGAMTTGRVVTCDPDGPRYHLPAEHAAVLTREAGSDNMAVFAQYLGLMGTVEDRVLHCFRNGGGVPYAAYDRFVEVMAEDSGQTVLSCLFDSILPLVPGIDAALRSGIRVLDIGCGQGRALNLLARTYPASTFVGYDLLDEAVAGARAEAAESGLANVTFEQRDLTSFDGDAPEAVFDLVTAFDAIHDQARPDKVLEGIYRALKPGGWFLMQDIAGSSDHWKNLGHPIAPFLYTISTLHCMTVSLAQNGMGLGTMWGREKAREMLREAGFDDIHITSLDHDPQNEYYVTRKH